MNENELNQNGIPRMESESQNERYLVATQSVSIRIATQREIVSESCFWILFLVSESCRILHFNCNFPIDLAPNGVPFGDKSFEKV